MRKTLPHYVRVKDDYCCLYLGGSPEYAILLEMLKPQIESQLPGMKFWICCDKSFGHLFVENKEVVFEMDRDRFAYVRELRNDFDRHAVMSLMEESLLQVKPVAKIKPSGVGMCLICPEGIPPVKPMSQNEVDSWKSTASRSGFVPIVVGSDGHHSLPLKLRPSGKDKLEYVEGASWVVGVENEYTLMAARKGIRTTLKKDMGHELFRKLVPEIELV